MTELEETGLTDGHCHALSAHRSKAYEGYAKRTEKRAIEAACAPAGSERHENAISECKVFQNEVGEEQNAIA